MLLVGAICQQRNIILPMKIIFLCAIVGEKRLKNGELYIHWKIKKFITRKDNP